MKQTRNIRIRSKRNTSGCTGVTYAEKEKAWRARIWVDGDQLSLGYFPCKEDAIAERKRAEVRYGRRSK